MRGENARARGNASHTPRGLPPYRCAASSWRIIAWASRLWQDHAGERDRWGARYSDICHSSSSGELIKIVGDDQELGVPFISVSAPSIVSGMSGESEKTLRETFEEAKVRLYFFVEMLYGSLLILDLPSLQRVAPSLLFIDEIDAITPKRESAQREMERRIVAQFLTCMDGMVLSEDTYTKLLQPSVRVVMGKDR
jgi:hypothetical protein